MSTISPQLDQVIRDVGDPTSPVYRNLRAVIEESLVLMQQMNDAVAQGHLKHFAWMSASENSGASFSPDTQTINLKREDLLDSKRRDALTFIMGHEIQHGLNRERTRQGYEQFSQDALQVLQSGQQIHDYTPTTQRMLTVHRDQEKIHPLP